MKTMVFYKDSGEITSVRSGDDKSIDAEIDCHNGEQFILTDKTPDYLTYYVDNGDVFRKPEQQNQYQEFDYQTKQWVFSLDYSRSLKWEEIKTIRTVQEFSEFAWQGHIFQCNEVSQKRIQSAVQLAILDDLLILDWTLANNSVETFNAANFVSIGKALANHVSECHQNSRIKREEIYQATTEAELAAITW